MGDVGAAVTNPHLAEAARVEQAATLYEVLGVASDAPTEAVVAAYRQRTLLLHPDRSRTAATQHAFVALQTAYDCLKDDAQRARYDAAMLARRRRGADDADDGGGLAPPFRDGEDDGSAAMRGFFARQFAAAAGDDDAARAARLGDFLSFLGGMHASQAYTSPASTGPPKCRMCGVAAVPSAHATCRACLTGAHKAGRCKRLGCFNAVPAGADTPGRGDSAGWCDACRARPVKCAAFGCLRKTSPAVSPLCEVHRAAA